MRQENLSPAAGQSPAKPPDPPEDLVPSSSGDRGHGTALALAEGRVLTLDAIALHRPERAIEIVQNRIAILRATRRASLAATRGVDWTANKGKDDAPEDAVLMLRKSGAENVRKYYGISVHVHGPATIVTEGGRRYAVVVGDGVCGLTGEVVEQVTGRRGESEKFVGRAQEVVGLGDLLQAARTSLETKCVRMLTGMSSVTPQELAEAWGVEVREVLNRVVLGSGFGTSQERRREPGDDDEEEGGEAPASRSTPRSGGGGGTITEPQAKRMWAKACARAEILGLKAREGGERILRAVLANRGLQRSNEVRRSDYDAACEEVDAWSPEAPDRG